jgi:hypothetical protein
VGVIEVLAALPQWQRQNKFLSLVAFKIYRDVEAPQYYYYTKRAAAATAASFISFLAINSRETRHILYACCCSRLL